MAVTPALRTGGVLLPTYEYILYFCIWSPFLLEAVQTPGRSAAGKIR
jgi:hypothetical protein